MYVYFECIQVSLSKSCTQLEEERTREIDELVLAKADLEHQLAGLKQTMKEKEGDYEMQVYCVLQL